MRETLIHARVLDDGAKSQIEAISRHPAVEGLVAIMPDAHAGAGCVIGFTGRFRDAVLPNVVGVDIGCGVLCVRLPGVERRSVSFEALDGFIRRRIPLGKERHRQVPQLERDETDLCGQIEKHFYRREGFRKFIDPALQVGSLGGGNHFIEIDEDAETGELFLVIHSGSRNFGKQAADFYQARARQWCKKQGLDLPTGLEYLPLAEGGDEYLRWLRAAQAYARMNRHAMARIICGFFRLSPEPGTCVESVHNYIDPEDGMVRKGAIRARQGERVVIPLNMAAGVVLGEGRGNPRYNHSAPHGAGRRFGRTEMRRMLARGELSMEAYRSTMEGVFSTSVNRETIDEAPFAYKDWEDIREELQETVEVRKRLRPVYNLKAEE